MSPFDQIQMSPFPFWGDHGRGGEAITAYRSASFKLIWSMEHIVLMADTNA
jgi:hypothetical protein